MYWTISLLLTNMLTLQKSTSSHLCTEQLGVTPRVFWPVLLRSVQVSFILPRDANKKTMRLGCSQESKFYLYIYKNIYIYIYIFQIKSYIFVYMLNICSSCFIYIHMSFGIPTFEIPEGSLIQCSECRGGPFGTLAGTSFWQIASIGSVKCYGGRKHCFFDCSRNTCFWNFSSWWFPPLWKIFVKLEIFPKWGWK